MSLEKKPKAVDLSHHLSEASRKRQLSPLKGYQKYYRKPGMISLAGGLPSPSYFPFSSISAETISLPITEPAYSLSWLWRIFGSSKDNTTQISIPKYTADTDEINLATALQYGPATGLTQLVDFTNEFTKKVFQPAYDDFATLVHTGSTDGWNRVVSTLCNTGEGILTEEWTYASATATMAPYGVAPVAVPTDNQGMRSDILCEMLSTWDETVRKMPRPHVMYTIPVGQNPCGFTMAETRKKEIYNICVQYDIIVVEDDPYYFLQEGEYVPKADRKAPTTKTSKNEDVEYISGLSPSYLKYDYQGRVIRLDTFSKTIAPGSRLGWFTCSPLFAERFERQGETSTQSPCGFGTAVVTKLLTTWKYQGYIKWLKALGIQYTLRRDYFIDCLDKEFGLQRSMSADGISIYSAFSKPARNLKEKGDRKLMFSFVPPTSGMFVWLKLHLENHPAYELDGEETLETKLWTSLADAGVLFSPGFIFSAEDMREFNTGHFRISFSDCELKVMEKVITTFGRVINDFFHEKADNGLLVHLAP